MFDNRKKQRLFEQCTKKNKEFQLLGSNTFTDRNSYLTKAGILRDISGFRQMLYIPHDDKQN